MLLNYHIGCFFLGLLCVGVWVRIGYGGIRAACSRSAPKLQHTANQERNSQCGSSTT